MIRVFKSRLIRNLLSTDELNDVVKVTNKSPILKNNFITVN
jgi:hypothetical protein